MRLDSTEVFSAFQGAYIRHLTYANDPANFAGSERLLDSYISSRGVREWLSSSDRDWRPQFAAVVQQRVKAFEDAAEEAAADDPESSSMGTDE